MITAKELREKLELDIKQLQLICRHESTSEAYNCFAPSHFSGTKSKYCTVCEKTLETFEAEWEPQQFVFNDIEDTNFGVEV